MKVATTIQITAEEDREISELKTKLGLPSKKAVVIEGIRNLREIIQDQRRRQRLQAASREVRKRSFHANREWAPLSTALKTR